MPNSLQYWLLNGATNLESNPIHARIYADTSLFDRQYIQNVVKPRSNALSLPSRTWSFSDPGGIGNGRGWALHLTGTPDNLLFTGYNPGIDGSRYLALYDTSNNLILTRHSIFVSSTQPSSSHFGKVMIPDPFFQNQEVGGADTTPFWAIRMFLAGVINWPVMPWALALMDDTFSTDRQTVRYTTTFGDLPSGKIIATASVPNCHVDGAGMAISSPTRFDGIVPGKRVGSYALYHNGGAGEILRIQPLSSSGGGILVTSGVNPIWVTDMRLTFNYQ